MLCCHASNTELFVSWIAGKKCQEGFTKWCQCEIGRCMAVMWGKSSKAVIHRHLCRGDGARCGQRLYCDPDGQRRDRGCCTSLLYGQPCSQRLCRWLPGGGTGSCHRGCSVACGLLAGNQALILMPRSSITGTRYHLPTHLSLSPLSPTGSVPCGVLLGQRLDGCP